MDTHSLLPLIGLLVAAAITPGPNNFIVMEAGARGGLVGAGRAALGVILGSVLLLALILAGVGRFLEQFPQLGVVLSLTGGTYLAWLGVSLLLRANAPREKQGRAPDMPSSLLGVTAFQFANPKAWILVATAAAAVAGTGGALQLALVLVLVTGLCLGLWGVAGAAAAQLLARPRFRSWFDRTMGVLLATSALALVRDAIS